MLLWKYQAPCLDIGSTIIMTYLHPKPNDRKWFIGLFFIALSIIGFFCIRELKWLIMAYMFGTYIVLIAVPEVWFGVTFNVTHCSILVYAYSIVCF